MVNKQLTLFSIIFLLLNIRSEGQVLCINCYRQNPPVSTNITNLILNGSFESSTCSSWGTFCPNATGYACDLDNWVCTGGGTSTYAHLTDSSWSIVPDGLRSAYFGNQYCNLCSQIMYDTSCVSREGCTVTGIPPGYPENNSYYGGTTGLSLSQTVTGLVPGNVYVVEFWTGGENGGTIWTEDGIFGFDIGFGNVYLSCPSTPFPAGTGKRYIVQFAATSSSHTLKFTNWGHTCSSCTELILDDVRIYPISQLSSIIPACALGFENMDNASVSVNAGDHFLRINTDRPGEFTLKIYNSLSAEVRKEIFTGHASSDLTSLAGGMYFYEIRDKTGLIQKGKFYNNE
jgi:hypothetical protein